MPHKPYENRYFLHNRKYQRQCMLLNIFLDTCPDIHALAKMAKIPPKFGEYSYEVAKGFLWKWRFWPNDIFGENGECGEHSPKGQFESGDFTEKGKFGEKAKSGALSPKFGECSYDVAKAPLWEWRFWRKWQVLRTSASFRKNSNKMAKGPFESGDFYENEEYGETSPKP